MQLISDGAVIFFPEVNFICRDIYCLLYIGIMLKFILKIRNILKLIILLL